MDRKCSEFNSNIQVIIFDLSFSSQSDFALKIMPMNEHIHNDVLNIMVILQYRVLFIVPVHQFSLARFFELGTYELILIAFLLAFVLCHLLVEKVYLPGSVSIYEVIFRIVSGCFGQEPHLRPKSYSRCIILVTFFFFVFINYIAETSFVISVLTTPRRKTISSLEMVKHSDVPLFISAFDHKAYPTYKQRVR